MPLPETTRLRLLSLLLRLSGAVMLTAFLAIFLPVDWMASTHRWLGMGEFPRLPVVEYLARSIAALYGFHGVLLLIVATDPAKYRTIVCYIATVNVVFGLTVFGIDLQAGMPLLWTWLEGPPIVVVGFMLAWLIRPAPTFSPPSSSNSPYTKRPYI
jgi:hypothetical protein